MPRPITIDAREIEQIIEILEHRARAATHPGISSAWSVAAQDLKSLLHRHDATREPTADEDPDD